MSDLLRGSAGNGRSGANGASSARGGAGPVPAQAGGTPAGVRTPRDIMNQRAERERAKREAEQRAAQEQEDRRRSGERRAAPAGVAGGSDGQIQAPIQRPTDDSGYQTMGSGRAERTSGGPVQPSTAARLSDPASSRVRGTSQPPQPGTTSAALPSTSAPRAPAPQSRTAAAGPSQPRQPNPTSTATAGPSGATAGPSQQRDATVSSFPHAFERWEQLSSHWEGLTSYWIRRLEQNTEEVRNEPLGRQMSRQITDLSAAGANLFHAVVELQRLRASSERKFQRWFFETRAEQERALEEQARLRQQMETERQQRTADTGVVERAERDREQANRMVSEMRRELQIAKDEARRAWEELGRREQEERDRTISLREGQPTVVGGIQVLPTPVVVSRQGSSAQRPSTRDGSAYQGSQQPSMPTYREEDEPERYYQLHDPQGQGQSPTNTDPFTEQPPHHLHHEQDVSSMTGAAGGSGAYSGPYIPGSTPAISGSTVQTAIPPTTQSLQQQQQQQRQQPHPQSIRDQGALSPAPLQPHRGAPTTALSSAQATSGAPIYQHPGTFLHGQAPSTNLPVGQHEDDTQSYVPSMEGSDEGDEWEYDQHGNIVRDAHGHPVPYNPARHAQRPRAGTGASNPMSESDDEAEIQAELERERMHRMQYGTAGQQQQQPTGGAQSQAYRPSYEGEGYEEEIGPGQGVPMGAGRHYYPTRLSDVLEEDERSRTSPSRASERSRGYQQGYQ